MLCLWKWTLSGKNRRWNTSFLEQAHLLCSSVWECVHVTENSVPIVDNTVFPADIVKQLCKPLTVVAFDPIAAIIFLVIFLCQSREVLVKLFIDLSAIYPMGF